MAASSAACSSSNDEPSARRAPTGSGQGGVGFDGDLLGSKPPWEKVMWKKQPYPDNYTDASFLSALQTNNNLYLPSTATLIHLSLPISIHFNLVMAFVGAFTHLLNGKLSAITLCVLTLSTSATGWAACQALAPAGIKGDDASARRRARSMSASMRFAAAQAASASVRARSSASRRKRGPVARGMGRLLSLLLLALVLFALSPVLRTLTEATTSDSIWALSAALFCLNVASADYSSTPLAARSRGARQPAAAAGAHRNGCAHAGARLSQASSARPVYIIAGQNPAAGGGLAAKVSLNAGVCASVVLASRLQSNGQVFALLLFSMQVFALGPAFRARVIGLLVERADRAQAAATGKQMPDKDAARSGLPRTVLYFQAALFVLSLLLSVGIFAALGVSARADPNDQQLASGARSAVAIHLGVIAFVSLVCPVWMRRSQRRKRRLNGPWDPAVPIIRAPES